MAAEKKALFFPGFSGRGYGHIHRCLALADGLSHQNWKTAFVLAGPNTASIEEMGYPVYYPRFIRTPSGELSQAPAYTVIQDGAVQAIRDGLTHPWRVWLAVFEAIRFIKHYQPDILIGDSSLLTWIAGRRTQLPVVQIIQSIIHPQNPKIIWWQDPPANTNPLDIRPVFNPLLKSWKMDPIQHPEDLLKGDLYLVPGIPATDPLSDWIKNTHYVGALIHDNDQDVKLPIPLDDLQDRPVLYVTLGGSASPGLLDNILKAISEIMVGTSWWVVMSLGSRYHPLELADLPSNVFCFPWLPGWATIQRSRAIVFHGGHTTMMETINAGIPAVVIPSQSEQESNGRRMEACSAAIVVSPAEGSKVLILMKNSWRYGKFNTWIVPEFLPDPNQLKESIGRIIEDPVYQQGAATLKLMSSQYGGVKSAVEMINSIIP